MPCNVGDVENPANLDHSNRKDEGKLDSITGKHPNNWSSTPPQQLSARSDEIHPDTELTIFALHSQGLVPAASCARDRILDLQLDGGVSKDGTTTQVERPCLD
jgi:hypothetical protein